MLSYTDSKIHDKFPLLCNGNELFIDSDFEYNELPSLPNPKSISCQLKQNKQKILGMIVGFCFSSGFCGEVTFLNKNIKNTKFLRGHKINVTITVWKWAHQSWLEFLQWGSGWPVLGLWTPAQIPDYREGRLDVRYIKIIQKHIIIHKKCNPTSQTGSWKWARANDSEQPEPQWIQSTDVTPRRMPVCLQHPLKPGKQRTRQLGHVW